MLDGHVGRFSEVLDVSKQEAPLLTCLSFVGGRNVLQGVLKGRPTKLSAAGKKTSSQCPFLHSLLHTALLVSPLVWASELLPAESRRVSLFLEWRGGIEGGVSSFLAACRPLSAVLDIPKCSWGCV